MAGGIEPAATRRTIVAGACAFVAGCLDDTGDGESGDEGGGNGDGGSGDGADGVAGDQAGDDSADEDSDANDANPATGEVTQMGALELSSPEFDDGKQIPIEYGYDERNVNPPLRVENVPEEATSLALVMDDPDAVEPAGTVWDHWIVWNIPPDTTTIPEDWTPSDATEGSNDYGERGYGGPNPPDGEHRYRFKLYAVDTTFDLPSETDADALGESMEGHVVEQTQLDGTYPA